MVLLTTHSKPGNGYNQLCPTLPTVASEVDSLCASEMPVDSKAPPSDKFPFSLADQMKGRATKRHRKQHGKKCQPKKARTTTTLKQGPETQSTMLWPQLILPLHQMHLNLMELLNTGEAECLNLPQRRLGTKSM